MMTTAGYTAEPAMQIAQHYQERNRGIPVNPDVAFTNHKGERTSKCEQRQKKLLSTIGFLRPTLDDDETVVLVTTACSPFSLLEQLLGGWIVVLLKRSLLVFTNKRFFHVPTTSAFKYRGSLAAVDYTWCQSIQVRGGALHVGYHGGKRERFAYLDRREMKKLRCMFKDIILPLPNGDPKERTFLCPNCGSHLMPEVQPCAHCGQTFRDKKTARWLSLLLPGGGYFYCGHPLLGVMDALVETYLSVYVVILALGVLLGAFEALAPLGLFAGILALEKLVTVYESNHFLNEFLPKRSVTPYAEVPPELEVSPPDQQKSLSPEEVLRPRLKL